MIAELYKEKMEDGTFEKIAGAQINKMMTDVCGELMGYRGAVKTEMEKRLEPIMLRAIEKSDIGDMAVKLTDVINQTIRQAGLGAYDRMAKGIEALCGCPKVAFGESIKLSDIFARYCEYVSDEYDESDFSPNDINMDDSTKTASIDCQIEVLDDDAEKSYYTVRKTRTVKLSNDFGLKKEDKTCFSFKLREICGKTRIQTEFDYSLFDIARLSKFAVYLMALEQHWAEIDIDITSDEGYAEFEFDWN